MANRLTKPVRRIRITADSLVRQMDPKPKKNKIYEFSNGRVFLVPDSRNPYV